MPASLLLWSAIATASARRRCGDELLARAWAARSAFIYAHRDLAATVAAANRLQNSVPAGEAADPLLDHADNVAFGGTRRT